MTPALIQRHHDYVLGPSQDARLASVTPGQTLSVELTTDNDAPFMLRSRAMRVKYASPFTGVRTQPGLNHLLLRWTGPNRDYRAQHLVRQSLYGPYFGQLGNPIPVFPQVAYPRQSTITVDVSNDGSAELTNLTLYFRGVKLFAPGAIRSYDYPAKFGMLPFVYPQVVNNLPVTQLGPLRQIFRCKPDADFVFRAGQAGLPFNETPVNEVFIQLKDEDEKPYSNAPVHIDVMFGNADIPASFIQQTVATGPNSPGLIFPEIYIPKNHIIYYDVTRTDASYANAAAVNLPISFIGCKVFQK
jgi:hypothetical protein